MAKKKHLKLEYTIVLFVLLGFLLLVMPLSLESNKQATFISKWNENYNRIEYMFSVINAHITDDMLLSMKKADTPHKREQILLTIIKPYLRINTENSPKNYRPRYVNGQKIDKTDLYYFSDFYYANHKTIIGIKDLQSESKNDAFFIMMIDINGKMPPNRWGKDIFGINIYDEGKIEPFGQSFEMPMVASDCSERGVYCSYYYKIGGGFDD